MESKMKSMKQKKLQISGSYIPSEKEEFMCSKQIEYFKKVSKNVFEISARLLIEDFEKRIGNFLRDDEIEKYDTVGGLVFALLEIVYTANIFQHKLTRTSSLKEEVKYNIQH